MKHRNIILIPIRNGYSRPESLLAIDHTGIRAEMVAEFVRQFGTSPYDMTLGELMGDASLKGDQLKAAYLEGADAFRAKATEVLYLHLEALYGEDLLADWDRFEKEAQADLDVDAARDRELYA